MADANPNMPTAVANLQNNNNVLSKGIEQNNNKLVEHVSEIEKLQKIVANHTSEIEEIQRKMKALDEPGGHDESAAIEKREAALRDPAGKPTPNAGTTENAAAKKLADVAPASPQKPEPYWHPQPYPSTYLYQGLADCFEDLADLMQPKVENQADNAPPLDPHLVEKWRDVAKNFGNFNLHMTDLAERARAADAEGNKEWIKYINAIGTAFQKLYEAFRKPKSYLRPFKSQNHGWIWVPSQNEFMILGKYFGEIAENFENLKKDDHGGQQDEDLSKQSKLVSVLFLDIAKNHDTWGTAYDFSQAIRKNVKYFEDSSKATLDKDSLFGGPGWLRPW